MLLRLCPVLLKCLQTELSSVASNTRCAASPGDALPNQIKQQQHADPDNSQEVPDDGTGMDAPVIFMIVQVEVSFINHEAQKSKGNEKVEGMH